MYVMAGAATLGARRTRSLRSRQSRTRGAGKAHFTCTHGKDVRMLSPSVPWSLRPFVNPGYQTNK